MSRLAGGGRGCDDRWRDAEIEGVRRIVVLRLADGLRRVRGAFMRCA
ncbi:MAG: hypothetical protein ACKESB_03175 [Candidatus Hodgkinia cicadicola]